MIPVFNPASRANDMAVPSCAWKPLASIRLVLLKPNPPSPPCWFARSSTLCCAPAGAGKIHILPSVRTPSTSKRMSLIFLARGLDIRAILALESSMIYQQSMPGSRHFGFNGRFSDLRRHSSPQLGNSHDEPGLSALCLGPATEILYPRLVSFCDSRTTCPGALHGGGTSM